MIRYALATLALPLLIGADAPSERVIDGDHLIAVTINGIVTRLRVDPSAPSIALVTPEVAQRAGLRMGRKLGIGFTYGVGPMLVSSSTAVARGDFGAGQGKTRIGWTERTYSAANDGTIGPAALPDTTVRIVLHAPRAVERTMTLRYDQPGFPDTIFGIGWSHASGQVDLDGQPLSIRFAPHAPRTLATAGAAARLARVHGGSIAGDATMTQVAFGIARPVRTMTLERPFALGDLHVATLGVRIADDGTAATIREAGTPVPQIDPDEVVVTAGGRKRDVRRDVLTLGADVLGACSSITFDKPAHQIRLRCA
ncbi:hypothetical protein [uncultured Sphingomonas sp.]|uniref:hypothetical protein n=1 Tax=uncultured Sphingomonas sp. TaxID=158754 RepID=UPI00374A9616